MMDLYRRLLMGQTRPGDLELVKAVLARREKRNAPKKVKSKRKTQPTPPQVSGQALAPAMDVELD